ncbi:TetR/AcrR family transcriptional regulator [Nocardia sp. NPDC059246]|uniref:TetR/AcrR family transcriptional regulator n=1 Tax=unclassified Nocardia TaxID=2637762 RepID=UPI0036A8A2E1
MAHPTSRRDRKRSRIRNELVTAARSLIAEGGVADLRVIDVTERCDVALGSFYSHFKTKDDIIDAVVEETVTSLADTIGDVGDRLDDPAEALSVGARRLVGLCQTDPVSAQLLVRLEDAEPRFEQMIWVRAERIMRHGVETGRFRVEDPTLALTIAIAGVLAVIRGVVDGRLDRDIDAEAACAATILRAVGIDRDEISAIVSRPLPSFDDLR